MALFLQTVFLLAAITPTVYGCVCYVGQETDGAAGKRYGWSLAEQRPCECTEFRLGGVNMKPQKKFHEVKIGDDPRVSINDQDKLVQSPDCNVTKYEPAVPCPDEPSYRFKIKELQEMLTSPIRLRLTVPEVKFVIVYFSPTKPGTGDATYDVYLEASRADIERLKPSHGVLKRITGINYLGEQLIITYDNGHFEVAIPGLPESTLTYDIPSAPPTSWYISFKSDDDNVDWKFFEPCISEFHNK